MKHNMTGGDRLFIAANSDQGILKRIRYLEGRQKKASRQGEHKQVTGPQEVGRLSGGVALHH